MEYEGSWYSFYHNRVLANRDGYSEYQRSITLDQLTYDADGTILEVPAAMAARQRTKIEVPQMAHFRFHERFRWPVEQVLLVGFGMVALPVPSDGQSLVAGLPLPLPSSPPRADVLVFVESKGTTGQASRATTAGRPEATTYRGRY